MKKFSYILIAIFAFAVSLQSKAQTSASSYFIDGAYYNYKLNPAMKAERGFFSILVGNLSVGTKGNAGVSTFLYPKDDKLTTFMSGSVDADEFLSKLDKDFKMALDYDMTLLAAGWRAFGGYMTFDVSLRSSSSALIPKGFFEFAKRGLQKDSYDIAGVALNSLNYASVGLGYSHEIIEGLRFGANAKYLLGLVHADLRFHKLNFETNNERCLVESHAIGQVGIFCEPEVKLDDDGNITGINLGDMESPQASGFGIDLGVEYDLDKYVPGLKVSASVLDLGFIKWKSMVKAHSAGTKVEYNGLNEIEYDQFDERLDEELDRLADDFAELAKLKYDGTEVAKTSLNTTMHIGAQYSMPFYKPLSVAALYSQRFSKYECNKWYQVRGYVNVAPTGWFAASVNYGYSTHGQCLGWMLNFHPAGINFFIGSDYMITKVTPQYAPLNDMNSHVTMGLSFAIGKKK